MHSTDNSNNNNFVCDVCGKSFARKTYLQRHRATHTRKSATSATTGKKNQIDQNNNNCGGEGPSGLLPTATTTDGVNEMMQLSEHLGEHRDVESSNDEFIGSGNNPPDVVHPVSFLTLRSSATTEDGGVQIDPSATDVSPLDGYEFLQ